MIDNRHVRRAAGVVAGTALVAAAGVGIGTTTADAAPAHRTVRSCGAHQLAVRTGESQGGVGHGGFPLVFRNDSTTTCTLTGYPGVDALGRHSTVLASARRTRNGYLGGAAGVRTITLRPGRSASAFVEWVDMRSGGAQCRASRATEVTAPDTFHSVRLAAKVDVCDLQVHPVVAGTTGDSTAKSPYRRARAAWIRSAAVSAAEQDRYLDRAADDLAGARHDHGTQVRQLRRLAGLPETDTTAHQRREAKHLVAALDRYFHTPKLYR